MIVPIASIAYVTTLQIRLVPKIDPSLLTIGSTAILVNAGTGMVVQNYFAGESMFGKNCPNNRKVYSQYIECALNI